MIPQSHRNLVLSSHLVAFQGVREVTKPSNGGNALVTIEYQLTMVDGSYHQVIVGDCLLIYFKSNYTKNGHKEHPESEQQFVDISQSVVQYLV